jgi:hypothetical protein
MITPNNRKQYEQHINILAESIRNGKFHIPPDRRLLQSLLNIKSLPNKRLNLLTIDNFARLLGNSIKTFSSVDFKNEDYVDK